MWLYFTYRNLLAYIFIPVIGKELKVFKETIWNNHRIRHQKDTFLPDGVPEHMYNFPQEYGLEECGKAVLLISNVTLNYRK